MSGSSSNLGQLVLLLHGEAKRTGSIKQTIECREEHEAHLRARVILRVIGAKRFEVRRPWKSYRPAVRAGIELRQGRVNDDSAKQVRKYVLSKLADYETFLLVADRLGYTTHVIRVALSAHWERLAEEELGSDGHCIRVDLLAAYRRASEDTRYVMRQLIENNGPQQLTKALGVNGSRMVSKALYELSNILEGRQ